jgi:hypothetical protein
MKKMSIIAVFLLFSGITYGQKLEKGNLVGLHIFTLNLDPDVTYNQFKNFFVQKYIPELDKNYPDVKHYFAEGSSKRNENQIGLIIVFESQEVKNKYYNEDGSTTELMNSIQEKIKPVRAELDRLGKVTAEYTEWTIQ